MPNPFEFVSFVRELGDNLERMNNDLTTRLDQIIELLKQIEKNTDNYGDGR